jgi:hypothetical protein
VYCQSPCLTNITVGPCNRRKIYIPKGEKIQIQVRQLRKQQSVQSSLVLLCHVICSCFQYLYDCVVICEFTFYLIFISTYTGQIAFQLLKLKVLYQTSWSAGEQIDVEFLLLFGSLLYYLHWSSVWEVKTGLSMNRRIRTLKMHKKWLNNNNNNNNVWHPSWDKRKLPLRWFHSRSYCEWGAGG